MSNLVFVYGSLKKGFYNNPVINQDGSKLICKATTIKPYTMISMGSFPAIFKDKRKQAKIKWPASKIKGEVWSVSDKTLHQLDMLEGVPHLYTRETTTVETDNYEPSNIEVIIYELANPDKYVSRYGMEYTIFEEWTHDDELLEEL